MNTVSFRLPDDVVARLERLAKKQKTPKTALARAAIERFLHEEELALPALISHLVDYPGSGRGDLAANAEKHLRTGLGRAKRSR